MIPPHQSRLLLFGATLMTLLGLVPWLATQTGSGATGLVSQICTSLGILEAPQQTPAPPTHQHP